MKNILLATHGPSGRTGSTALANIIHALLGDFGKIRLGGLPNDQKRYTGLVKTHATPSPELGDHFDLIVSVERLDTTATNAESKYKLEGTPFLLLNYSEVFQQNRSPEEIVDFVASKLKDMLPDIEMYPDMALKRLNFLTRTANLIKDLPFSKHDPYTSVHGHHRNRGKKLNDEK